MNAQYWRGQREAMEKIAIEIPDILHNAYPDADWENDHEKSHILHQWNWLQEDKEQLDQEIQKAQADQATYMANGQLTNQKGLFGAIKGLLGIKSAPKPNAQLDNHIQDYQDLRELNDMETMDFMDQHGLLPKDHPFYGDGEREAAAQYWRGQRETMEKMASVSPELMAEFKRLDAEKDAANDQLSQTQADASALHKAEELKRAKLGMLAGGGLGLGVGMLAGNKPVGRLAGVSLGMLGGTMLGGLSGYHGFEQRHPEIIKGLQEAQDNENHHRNAWLDFMDKHDAWSNYNIDYDIDDYDESSPTKLAAYWHEQRETMEKSGHFRRLAIK